MGHTNRQIMKHNTEQYRVISTKTKQKNNIIIAQYIHKLVSRVTTVTLQYPSKGAHRVQLLNTISHNVCLRVPVDTSLKALAHSGYQSSSV